MQEGLQYSFKELYDVRIKSTYNMEINGRQYEEGETIAIFDKIQLSNINEIQKTVSARGGFENRERVSWTTTQEVQFAFSQGVFSKTEFSLLTNAKLLSKIPNISLSLDKRERLESNENGEVVLGLVPNKKPFFYNAENMEKIILTQDIHEPTHFSGAEPYTEMIVDYSYDYTDEIDRFQIGARAFPGYVSLEGKTKIKDDNTGRVRTGIIKIPKMRILSNLSITLGEKANPVVGTFFGKGVPVGPRGNSTVLEMCILDEDIDTDI